MIQYTNKKLCKRCGGTCCKRESCIYAPEDFEELTFDSLLELYQKEKIMFTLVHDLNTGEKLSWIVRPAQVAGDRIQFDINEKQSSCKFLTATGCSYSYHERPRGGKLLIPKEINGMKACELLYDVDMAISEWKAYTDIIDEVVSHIFNIEREKETEFTFDHIQCKICGGGCCKTTGCFFSPKDFKVLNFERMKRIMMKGYISIIPLAKEYLSNQKTVYVLKVRNKNGAVVEEKNSTGGCIILEDSGCPFEDEDRPYGGKALVPAFKYGMPCEKGYSFKKCAEDWLPYQDLVLQLKAEFEGKDIEFDGIF